MVKQIILRDVTESDLPILFEQQLDPEATAMAAFPSRDKDAPIAANESRRLIHQPVHTSGDSFELNFLPDAG